MSHPVQYGMCAEMPAPWQEVACSGRSAVATPSRSSPNWHNDGQDADSTFVNT